MIKINLLVGKKPVDITNVGGFDLSKLSLRMMIFALILFYVPDFFVYDFLEEELKTKDSQIKLVAKEQKKLNVKVRSLKKIERQIKALEILEKKLHQKLGVVKEILKIRSNPMNILLYVSKNIPENLWLIDITFENNTVRFKGQSKSFKNIGIFIENLKSSIFFRKDTKLLGTNPNVELGVEEFEIIAPVVSYE
ncbi:MAG: Tfp pilus assembly protein PilN [Thermoproteota archaeon]|jgi:Tfp pilus assembly protein PilN